MKLVKERNTAQLVEMFEITDTQEMTPDLATVRGWIMDELQARNPEAFDDWITSDDDSPRKFFT